MFSVLHLTGATGSVKSILSRNSRVHLRSFAAAVSSSSSSSSLLTSSSSPCKSASSSSSSLSSSSTLSSFSPLKSVIFRRTFSYFSPSDHFELKQAEQDAINFPHDAAKRLRFYQILNKRGYFDTVVRHFERNSMISDPAIRREYAQASQALDSRSSFDSISSPSPLSSSPSYSSSSPSASSPSYTSAYSNYAPSGHAVSAYAPTAPANPLAFDSIADSLRRMLSYYEEQIKEGKGQRSARLLAWALTFILFGYTYYSMAGASGILGNSAMGPSRFKAVKTDKKFSDVKGCNEAKDELAEIVAFLSNPAKFSRLGGKMPKGILLLGPPGTGKTLLAKAAAGEANVPFFFATGSDFDEALVGVGARRIRELFELARKNAPCIVFIDEIDSLGGKRSAKDASYAKQTLNQLLTELDGFNTTAGVVFMGATNFAESLDPALLRPGRFDRQVNVPLPDVVGRKEILDLYLKSIPKCEGVDSTVLARGTPGCSGADLFALVNEAAVRAAVLNKTCVSMDDLEHSKDKVLMGPERLSAVIPLQERKNTAYHEAGHALLSLHTEAADPLHKVTIIPRGQALGITFQLPKDDKFSMTKKQLLARMDVLMGGRVAEEMIMGADNVTTGASNDLQQATRLATAMVLNYGMSQHGLAFRDAQELSNLSPDAKEKVDKEVQQLLDSAYSRAKNCIKTHEKELHALANGLVEHETLSLEEVLKVIKGHKLQKLPTSASAIRDRNVSLGSQVTK